MFAWECGGDIRKPIGVDSGLLILQLAFEAGGDLKLPTTDPTEWSNIHFLISCVSAPQLVSWFEMPTTTNWADMKQPTLLTSLHITKWEITAEATDKRPQLSHGPLRWSQ